MYFPNGPRTNGPIFFIEMKKCELQYLKHQRFNDLFSLLLLTTSYVWAALVKVMDNPVQKRRKLMCTFHCRMNNIQIEGPQTRQFPGRTMNQIFIQWQVIQVKMKPITSRTMSNCQVSPSEILPVLTQQ